MSFKIRHKKRLLVLLILGTIFIVFILPELIVLNTIRDLGLLSGKYKMERWSGCTTIFQNCEYGQRVTYVSTDSAENIFAIYNKKLSQPDWKKTFEIYHDFANDIVGSSVVYEEKIFMRKYTVNVFKTENAEFYPHENNQVSVYVMFY